MIVVVLYFLNPSLERGKNHSIERKEGEKEKDRGWGRFVFALRKDDVVENEFLVKWSNTSH